MLIAGLAYWLEEYVGIDWAVPAAWATIIAAIALLGGVAWLVVNGG